MPSFSADAVNSAKVSFCCCASAGGAPEIVIDGSTAHVTSISISAMGSFPVRTNFKREADGTWRVVSYG